MCTFDSQSHTYYIAFFNSRIYIYLGVERLDPKVSLLFELNTLPLKWEGMKRCIEFWVKVMRMGEDRLLKQVMMQVMELGDGVQWRQDLEKKKKV